MSAAKPLDEDSMKLGLLLEAAQTQQELIASELNHLQAHARGLDDIVREQIRRTLVEELGTVIEESVRAVAALRALERAAKLRFLAWTMAMTLLVAATTAVSVWWLLPTPSQMSALRLRRDQLLVELENLEQRGGRIDLRRCGSEQRWCVRIDRQAPAFGQQADYLIVKGY
ncbi:MAG TPA: hypothetical protein VGP20_09640 [Steroidobacteraceae bacterium]|jgi:hypothetical protein|nr:hypothetical protein [Steroidobacteraceae bacterium]